MFDISAPVSIAIESDGSEITGFFPPDSDWFARSRSIAIVRTLGRKGRIIATQHVRDRNLDHEIISRNFTGGNRLSFMQASRLVELLASVDDVQAFPDCQNWRVTMRPFNRFEVTHTLRAPTQAELRVHEELCDATRNETRQANRIVSRVAFEPSVALYDELLLHVDGYARDAVPAPHKWKAVLAVIEKLDAQASSPGPY